MSHCKIHLGYVKFLHFSMVMLHCDVHKHLCYIDLGWPWLAMIDYGWLWLTMVDGGWTQFTMLTMAGHGWLWVIILDYN